MSNRLPILLTACALLLGGCNLIYKQNIQQGNALEQEDLDKLRIGMSKNQVSFLMGTPAIQDPFHRDRWDYISTFSRRGGEPVTRLVTLYFENGVLSEMVGVDDDEFIFEDEPADSESADEVAAQPAGAEPEIAALAAPTTQDSAYPATAGATSAEPGAGDWAIQVGAFDQFANAEGLLSRLEAAGYDASIEQVEGYAGERFLVRKRGYESKESAQAALDRLQADLDISGFVVPAED